MRTQAPEPYHTLKPVAEGIWVADGPHIPAGRIPIPVRMTVARLGDGGLWLHSPIEAHEGLLAELKALGPVRHLVAPNEVHLSWMPDWRRRFPEALAWGAPGVRGRAMRKGMTIDWAGELSDEPPPDWAGEIDQLLVKGSPLHHEVVFLHRSSRTLILTDLIENLEARKLPLWLRPMVRLGGVAHPDGKAPPHLRMAYTNRGALRQSVEAMIAWAPEKVILAHGRWYDRDGTAELRRAFRWVLG